MKKIVLTGGGTAGHVTPCLALLPALFAHGYTAEYIGTHNGMEKELVKKAGIPYHAVSAGKLRRYASVKNITDAFRVIKGLGDAAGALRKIKPDIVFSKGGYVGVPVVYAARLLNIPVVLHEGDFSLGLANRLCAPFAKAVCVCFPETAEAIPKYRPHLTGMPIRAELLDGDRSCGRSLCGFGGGKPVLLVMGGSSGAVRINSALYDTLPKLIETFDIIHICGRGNADAKLRQTGFYQTEYAADEMPHIYAAADIVISRAGANAVSELTALNKPALYIPLGSRQSRGDQIQNARSAEKKGYAGVIPQEELTPKLLYAQTLALYENMAAYKEKMSAAPVNGAIDAVIQIINKYAKNG